MHHVLFCEFLLCAVFCFLTVCRACASKICDHICCCNYAGTVHICLRCYFGGTEMRRYVSSLYWTSTEVCQIAESQSRIWKDILPGGIWGKLSSEMFLMHCKVCRDRSCLTKLTFWLCDGLVTGVHEPWSRRGQEQDWWFKAREYQQEPQRRYCPRFVAVSVKIHLTYC